MTYRQLPPDIDANDHLKLIGGDRNVLMRERLELPILMPELAKRKQRYLASDNSASADADFIKRVTVAAIAQSPNKHPKRSGDELRMASPWRPDSLDNRSFTLNAKCGLAYDHVIGEGRSVWQLAKDLKIKRPCPGKGRISPRLTSKPRHHRPRAARFAPF